MSEVNVSKVERDINKRWEQGIEHHDKSIEIVKALADIDIAYCDMYFDWKTGGDGDNGETLMYLLDIYFESLDCGEPFIAPEDAARFPWMKKSDGKFRLI